MAKRWKQISGAKRVWLWMGALHLAVVAGSAAGAGGGSVLSDPGAMEGRHFHTKGKPASNYTVEAQQRQREILPFSDRRDFDEAKRGFIAAPAYKRIMAEAGNVAWDMGSYEWLLQGRNFDSIHPSLQRQAILNMGYGLFEVLPDRIYQVRGFDLANISFIKGKTGWIVFDPLTSKETAAAALAFAARESLANLFGGVSILMEGSLKLGDYIVLDTGERGKVTRIGLRSSRILTRDDDHRVIARKGYYAD